MLPRSSFDAGGQIDPAVGRAAFFSSGWENVHGIRPLVRGQRWALTTMFMVYGHASEIEASGAAFASHCVRPNSKQSYANCRQQWAAAMRQA